jgi:hypothetical protein
VKTLNWQRILSAACIAEVSLMDPILVVLLALVIAIGLLVLGGVFAEPIAAFIHRRFSSFSYEGDTFMVWGGLMLTAFVLGLLIMYLLLR